MLKKTGTLLHQSAADHVRNLAPVLSKYEVDREAMRAFLPPHLDTPPSCILHENPVPTQVVQMNVDDGLMASIKRELNIRALASGQKLKTRGKLQARTINACTSSSRQLKHTGGQF